MKTYGYLQHINMVLCYNSKSSISINSILYFVKQRARTRKQAGMMHELALLKNEKRWSISGTRWVNPYLYSLGIYCTLNLSWQMSNKKPDVCWRLSCLVSTTNGARRFLRLANSDAFSWPLKCSDHRKIQSCKTHKAKRRCCKFRYKN